MASNALLSVHPSESLDIANLTIPHVYRLLDREYPDRLFARSMNGDEDEGPIENISWRQLMRDVQAVTMIIAPKLVVFDYARPLSPTMVVGFLAASNYQYYVCLVAAWLLGWTPLLISTRNSKEAIEHLLRSGDAAALIFDKQHRETSMEIQSTIDGLILHEMDSVTNHEFLESSAPTIAIGETNDSDLDRVALYVHTSGSQGHPKLIPMTHRRFTATALAQTAAIYSGSPIYAPLPLFHGMGMYAFTRWPMRSGVVPTFVTMNGPLNGRSLLRHLRRLPGAVTFLAPSVLEEIASCPRSELAPLLSAKRVFYGGAPINPLAAEALVTKGVLLANSYGSSETSMLSVFDLPSDDLLSDWSYIRFQEDHYKLHFLPVDDSPVRELVISPSAKDSPAVINHNDPVGFASNDLWMPHPTREGLWKYMGRKDNVTVLSNGEKTDNKQIESLLLQDSRIKHVVVFGAGKLFNGVILSSSCGIDDAETFLDSIWETVQRANAVIPRHSRLIRQMVLIADANRPFMLSDKGTVRTRETLEIYKETIEAAYNKLEGTNSVDLCTQKNLQDPELVLSTVRHTIENIVRRSLRDEDNFFDIGLDSLHAFQIRSTLLIELNLPTAWLPYNVVYTHPTVSRLSDFLSRRALDSKDTSQANRDMAPQIESLLTKFTDGLPELLRPSTRIAHCSEGFCIAISGTTGSLGCYALQELLLQSEVKQIYCLHRGLEDMAFERQKQSFIDRGIPLDSLIKQKSKLEFLRVDLSSSSLGLSPQILEQLRTHVTHFIHAAWHLNFNMMLEQFEREHIAGVRHLIDLALSSARQTPPRFVFISSIGAVSHYTESLSVPEESFSDHSIPGPQGYSQAKYVAERIIDMACHRSGLNATIIRAGQLSGSTINGFWTPSEFIPILIISSRKIKSIPNEFPDTRWLPTDIAARAVIKLSLRSETLSPAYYHVENPTPTPWADVLKLYANIVEGPINVLSMDEWLKVVERTAIAHSAPLGVPAIQLLQFFASHAAARSSWVHLDVTKTRTLYPELDCGTLTRGLLLDYITWLEHH